MPSPARRSRQEHNQAVSSAASPSSRWAPHHPAPVQGRTSANAPPRRLDAPHDQVRATVVVPTHGNARAHHGHAAAGADGGHVRDIADTPRSATGARAARHHRTGGQDAAAGGDCSAVSNVRRPEPGTTSRRHLVVSTNAGARTSSPALPAPSPPCTRRPAVTVPSVIISMAHLVLAFLLVVVVHPVMATSGLLVETAPVKNICEDHKVVCNPRSLGVRPVIWISSIIHLILAGPAIVRVWGLKKRSRSEDDTLFWWHLCFSSGGSMVWVYYYRDCSTSDFAIFPIYGVSLLLALLYLILLCLATVATSGKTSEVWRLCDWRLVVMFGGPLVLWGIGYILRRFASIHVVGWFGCGVVSLAQSFRVASTDYRANGDLLCGFSLRKVFGVLSILGVIGGGLWLIDPQLCFSLEYKVTSYAVGLLRAWETVQWISRPVARALARIEGQMVD